jgi:hypothetical protein
VLQKSVPSVAMRDHEIRVVSRFSKSGSDPVVGEERCDVPYVASIV